MKTLRLFKDESFENGFTVMARRHGKGHKNVPIDTFNYPESKEAPKWFLEQWHTHHCIKKERFETKPYVLENSAKKVEVKPSEKYISLTLNGSAEYEGKPHNKRVLWPHLLLEQILSKDFDSIPESEKPFYSCDTGNMTAELDIRLKSFTDTDVREGILACQFMAYFYIQLKDSPGFIYFGIELFDSRGLMDTYWALDVEGLAMIYKLSTRDTFGGIENCFTPNGTPVVSDEWKHISVDLTPHIDKLIERINRDLVFGKTVSRKDFYLSGTNIGFETHGNQDCTIEIKNYNIASTVM